MILPALTEATSPFFRPIKYSLFPPLGLATLAAYLAPDDEVVIAGRACRAAATRRRAGPGRDSGRTSPPRTARIGSPITIGVAARTSRSAACTSTSLPDEAAAHADTIFLGPGEDTWPRVPRRLSRRPPAPRVPLHDAHARRTLPPIRRDLIKRHLYLVPNSIVVSRGCPHLCDFCYKEAFFAGGALVLHAARGRRALAEIERLPGRHLYFLDDHLFGDPRFATSLFDGMRGMGRLWQAAGTVELRAAAGPARAGRRRPGCAVCSSGFETLEPRNLAEQRQAPEPRPRLRRGDPSPPRPRRHDQRQLRVRHGRRRRVRVRPDGGLGGRARHRDRDVSHPDALSRHRAPRPNATSRAASPPQLGPVRHATRRLSAGPDVGGATGGRLLARVRPVLSSGARCCAARARTMTSRDRSGTSPTRRDGRSSSRCGIW